MVQNLPCPEVSLEKTLETVRRKLVFFFLMITFLNLEPQQLPFTVFVLVAITCQSKTKPPQSHLEFFWRDVGATFSMVCVCEFVSVSEQIVDNCGSLSSILRIKLSSSVLGANTISH